FSTIKVVSRHQNTQQYGAILPIELTIKDIRNTKAYKEYYACATGEVAPKPKARTGSKPGVPDVPSDDSEEELSWTSSDDKDVDEQTKDRDESKGEKTDESNDDDDDQEDTNKVNDDDDNEEEVPKIDEQETTESDEGDDEATKSDRES
nr:hypothetical protein [Tanacetum cinerariifolium]